MLSLSISLSLPPQLEQAVNTKVFFIVVDTEQVMQRFSASPGTFLQQTIDWVECTVAELHKMPFSANGVAGRAVIGAHIC